MLYSDTLTSHTKIQVLLAERFQESVEEIQERLAAEADIELVGIAKNSQEAINLAVTLQPDVVLMETNLPDVDGIMTTQHLLKQIPKVAVILTSYTDKDIRKAMMVGSKGYLVKPFSKDELVNQIHQAYYRDKGDAVN